MVVPQSSSHGVDPQGAAKFYRLSSSRERERERFGWVPKIWDCQVLGVDQAFPNLTGAIVSSFWTLCVIRMPILYGIEQQNFNGNTITLWVCREGDHACNIRGGQWHRSVVRYGGLVSVRSSHRSVSDYTLRRCFPDTQQFWFLTACRRFKKLVLPSIFDTNLSSLMMWNLQSCPTTVLNEIMWHF